MRDIMCKKRISDNPSFKKLERDIGQLKILRLLFPFIKPFLKDASQVEEGLNKIPELEQTLNELRSTPDRFNDLFANHGWIFNEIISLETAKQAIQAYEEYGLEKAEEVLVDYYSPEWVENHLVFLTFLPEFKERVYLTKKACDDYKSGRYYASVLVTLTLIDGWVNDLNIVEFQRKGFFAKDVKLVAWDSITAHSRGLVRLQSLFNKIRMQTRTEKITIPYRNGILHGMDLGFDNRIVAAKCWAALFSVRDWVIKMRKGELEAPPKDESEEKSLAQIINEYQESKQNIEKLKNWQPRKIIIGVDCPCKGKPKNYPNNSPEKILISFLEYWKNDNYGFMAKCYAPMFDKRPVEIRQEFQGKLLIDYELLEIKDIAPCTTDIIIKSISDINGKKIKRIYRFRLICNTKDGEMVYIQSNNSVWGITNQEEIKE